MEIITKPSIASIKKAAEALKDGHLVAFPTETVYGLGADATNEKAVRRIYAVKGRPSSHPLIVHVSSVSQMGKWAINSPQYAIKLAEVFWPGPMTLILRKSELGKKFITGGQDYIGLRVPDQSLALALIHDFELLGGSGIAAPSANRFGAVSPTNRVAVEEELGAYLGSKDLILDGGQCSVGLESTIIDCTHSSPKLLRPGVITIQEIELTTGLHVEYEESRNQIKASGLLDSHYSPKAIVIINEIAVKGNGLIAMAQHMTPPGVIRLAAPVDDQQYARQLYQALRTGDHLHLKKIVVIEPSGNGLAMAIRDRIRRSASKL